MPRFFFHVRHGDLIPDREGTRLPSVATARAEAVRTAGELVRDLGDRFWDAPDWRLQVTNKGGRTLFVLRVSVEEPPAVGR